MMKFTYILFGFIISLIFSISCSEDFLDVKNENKASDDVFYQSPQDFEDLLITGYMPLGFYQLFGQEAHVMNFAIDDRIRHENLNYSSLQYTSGTPEIYNIFNGLYIGVFRTNLFLEKLTEDIEIDEFRRITMLGEAHFLRGIYYFYLATWFEVSPILLSTPKDPLYGYSNSNKEDIYNLVVSDFKKAVEYLPETWSNSDLGRATSGAAMAFLGKTYLYQAQFDSAATILKELIDLGTYSLSMPPEGSTDSIDFVHAYLSNFTEVDLPGSSSNFVSEFNSESIFEINFGSFNPGRGQYLPMRWSTGSQMTWYFGYAAITGGFGNIGIDDDIFPNEFEKPESHPAGLKIDPRYYAIFINSGDSLDWRPEYLDYYRGHHTDSSIVFLSSDVASNLGTGMRKHLYPFHIAIGNVGAGAPNFDPNNWRLMRYADVLLMYAEASFRQSGGVSTDDGLNAINMVRVRAGMPALTSLNKDAIIHERDIEMAGEHSRFWDLSRWYLDGWLTLSDVQYYKPSFQPRHVCFPLPLREISRHNGVLKQNPKWL